MKNNGWVSINRSITDHWIWDEPFSQGQAWVDLIILANHKESKIKVKGKLIDVCRGQLAWSEISLSNRWKWSRGKTRRFLELLEKDGMIHKKSGHLTTIITICNYCNFQKNEQVPVQVSGQVSVQQTDKCRYTDNNVNKNNKENNKDQGDQSDKDLVLPEWLDKDLWGEWIAHRKKLKCPNSARALNKQINILIDIEKRLGLGNEALSQSYCNGWKGIFEPKIGSSKGYKQEQNRADRKPLLSD